MKQEAKNFKHLFHLFMFALFLETRFRVDEKLKSC